MNPKPIVFAMANPDPEILPEEAKKACPDVIVATGRSDYPNQVNNVLGFPFLFRGALDVGSPVINEDMKLAATYALSKLAKESVPYSVSLAYEGKRFSFGKDYIIPKPFDFRVLTALAPAVAKAAMDSGVAKKPIKDFEAYIKDLETLQSESRAFVKDVTSQVNAMNLKSGKKPCIYLPEGESRKVLVALNSVMPEGILEPVLLGNEKKIKEQIKKGSFSHLESVKIIDPKTSSKLEQYSQKLFEKKKEKGMNLKQAQDLMKNPNYFASQAVEEDEADALLTGATDSFVNSILPPLRILGSGRRGVVAGVNLVLLENKVLFFADTAFNINPTSEEVAHIAIYTAQVARHFNIEPRIAMLSFLNFTDQKNPPSSAAKMKEAVRLVKKWKPKLKVEGELQADIAVNKELSELLFPKKNLWLSG